MQKKTAIRITENALSYPYPNRSTPTARKWQKNNMVCVDSAKHRLCWKFDIHNTSDDSWDYIICDFWRRTRFRERREGKNKPMAISYSSFFANIVEKERITCFRKPAYCTDCSANKNNSMAIILRPTPKLIADRYHYYSIAACPTWLRYCAAFSVVNLHATSTTSLFVTFCSEDFRSLDDVIAAFVIEQTDWRLSNFGRRAFNIHSLSVHGSDVWSNASRAPAAVRSAGVDRRGRGTSSSFYLNQATWPINKHTKAYRQTE